jgi:hypothetical protein
MNVPDLIFVSSVSVDTDVCEFRVCVAKDEEGNLWHTATLTSANSNKKIFKLLGENPEKVVAIKTVNWSPIKCYGKQVKIEEIDKNEIEEIVTWYVEENLSYGRTMKEYFDKMKPESRKEFNFETAKIFYSCRQEEQPFEIFRVRVRNLAKKLAEKESL